MDTAAISQKNRLGAIRNRRKLKAQERELGIFIVDTEESEGAQKKYANPTGIVVICFGGLRERIIDRGEDRQRMQRSQGRNQDNINGNSPTILDGGERCKRISDFDKNG